MTVRVDYDIRHQPRVYPIDCDSSCLDTEPLKQLCCNINRYIEAVDRANILIEYAQGSQLLDIMREIAEEISYGRDEFDAVIMVSHRCSLPLNLVFLAYSLREDYRLAYERFIQANVIKILSDMGFKPMQIYRHINALPNVCYSYRGILEVLKAWQDGNFVALKFYNKVEVSIDK